jgi:hypothetical protein
MPDIWVERIYSQNLYPLMQRSVTSLSNSVPFAVFDLLFVSILMAFVVVVTRILRTSEQVGRFRRARLIVSRTSVVISLTYIIFLLAWGLNYRRVPLREKLDFDASRVTPQTLESLAVVAADELNALYPIASEQGWPPLSALPDNLGPAFQITQRTLGSESTVIVGRPKHSILTTYFNWSAIDGMLNPLSLEVLVNDNILPFERSSVIAHEWAHLAGYADESEASFVGWLTCLQGSISSQYSGWLMIYAHVSRQLPRESLARIRSSLSEGPREHLKAITFRLNRSIPNIRLVSRRVYDRFLKANRVKDGIESYDGVVTLVIGTRFEANWLPIVM